MSSSPSTGSVSASAPAPHSAPTTTTTEALYRAALADGDIGFYLPVFAAFDERGMARAHWNPAAALLHLNWLLYRRLWRAAALYTLAVGLAGLGLWWAGPWLGPLGPLLWLGLIGAALALPGWRGTAWLHNDVRRRMTAAVRRARTVQEACDALQRAQRRRPLLWGAGVLQAVVLVLVGLDTSWQTAPDGFVARPPAVAAPVPAAPPAPTAGPVPSPGPVAPGVPAAPVASATPAAPPAGEVRPRLRGFGVNVGLFADPANAERVRQRLAGAGLPVRVDPVESARGPLTRVRVGPLDDAQAAAQAAEQVRALGLDARVFGP